MGRPKYTDDQRILKFWSRVIKSEEPDACWLWIASKTKAGYGHTRWGDAIWYVHRISYQIAFGAFPPELEVCHSCDEPACVNPSHLFLGSHHDNMQDRNRKGRQAKGETSGTHKLTTAQVIEIRRRYAAGEATQNQLAAQFSVDRSHISNIVTCKKWTCAS